jgi:hypothetical protein
MKCYALNVYKRLNRLFLRLPPVHKPRHAGFERAEPVAFTRRTTSTRGLHDCRHLLPIICLSAILMDGGQ